MIKKTPRSTRNAVRELRLAWGGAALEESAGSEELGVEQGGACGAADKVVREQREFYIEQGTFADAADDGGHAVAGVNVAAGLGAILVVEDDNGVSQSGREGGQLRAEFEISPGFANFIERSEFF